jgi:HD-like signal output (HDOD) protein
MTERKKALKIEIETAKSIIKGLKITGKPALLQEIEELLNKTFAVTDEVAELIEQDSGISGSVLDIINSAHYNMQTQIISIKHAISLLGMREIKSLVIAKMMKQSLKNDSKIAQNVWNDSYTTAVCSRMIAKKMKKKVNICPDEAYMVGLFHDCGILILEKKFPNKYPKIVEDGKKIPMAVIVKELKLYGTSHPTISTIFAKKWKLPINVINAIYHHHTEICKNIKEDDIRALIAIVKIASQISHNIDMTNLNPPSEEQGIYVNPAKKELNISDDEIEEWADFLSQKIYGC